MKPILKIAIFGLMTAFPGVLGAQNEVKIVSVSNNPLMVQEHLVPSDYIIPYDGKGNDVCWGYKMEPSFIEGYEVKCVRNRNSQKFTLFLNIENQDKPYMLEIEEKEAWEIRQLIDAAVMTASYLPSRSEVKEAVELMKAGKEVPVIGEDGLDGAYFHFCNNRHGAYCWSPHDGNNAQLAAVAEIVYNAIAYKDKTMVTADMLHIRTLTKSYIDLLPEPFKEYYSLRMTAKRPDSWWSD